jgi:hypothetical protein
MEREQTLRIRQPAWASALELKLNGKSLAGRQAAGGAMEIRRRWKARRQACGSLCPADARVEPSSTMAGRFAILRMAPGFSALTSRVRQRSSTSLGTNHGWSGPRRMRTATCNLRQSWGKKLMARWHSPLPPRISRFVTCPADTQRNRKPSHSVPLSEHYIRRRRHPVGAVVPTEGMTRRSRKISDMKRKQHIVVVGSSNTDLIVRVEHIRNRGRRCWVESS